MDTKLNLNFIFLVNCLIISVHSKSVNLPDICKLEPQSGPCFASFSRYYFSSVTGQCELFVYGGCIGNGNNFQTEEDCRSLCATSSSKSLSRSTREAVEDKVKDEPLPITETNGTLEHPSNDQTTTVAAVTTTTTTAGPNNGASESQKKREDVCFQPFAEGTCKENLIRYYYDPEVNKCKKFIFKGCFQYDNNFEKLEDCESLCVVPNPSR